MGPGLFDTLLSRLLGTIEKGKKYLKPGQKAPIGKKIYNGARGGRYYMTEDPHTTVDGQHHKLIRGMAVTADNRDHVRKLFQSQGAKSVEFFRKPNGEADENGNPHYSVYVNWGDSTQKEIKEKKESDLMKYHSRRLKDVPETTWKDDGRVHRSRLFRHTDPGEDGHPRYMEHGHMEIHPSGQFGAKLYHIDNDGSKRKVAVSYEPVFGEASETDIDTGLSRFKNIETLKEASRMIQHRGGHYLRMLIGNQERLDQEKEEKRKAEEASGKPKKEKPPAKNPIWELKQVLKRIKSGLGPEEEPAEPEEKKEPEPVPVVVPEEKPAAASKKGFRLDGTYQTEENAKREAAKQEAAGYETEIRPKKIGKGTYFAVYIRKKPAEGPVEPEVKPAPEPEPEKHTCQDLEDACKSGDQSACSEFYQHGCGSMKDSSLAVIPEEKREPEPVPEEEPKERPEPDERGWVSVDGRFEMTAKDRDGNVEGIYTVEPAGKYSAAISFTGPDGFKERLYLKKERENRQEVNINAAKREIERYGGSGIAQLRYHFDQLRGPDSDEATNPISEMLRAMREGRKNRTTPWTNSRDLSFNDHEEARAWARNNLKTPITGLEATTGLEHAAHLMDWTKRFEDRYNMAIPGRIHLGVHSDWGRRPLGVYYYSSNSMHFRQDKKTAYGISHKAETKHYLEKKEEKTGFNDGVPFTCSDHDDATYWHEFGHLLDHLTKNGLSKVINSLSPDEKKQIRDLSDYPSTYNRPIQRDAEYAAEAVSAVMTGERTEYVPDRVKEAIKKAFEDMPHLAIDLSIEDPIHSGDWTDVEGEFYNKVKLPDDPKNFTDGDLEDYYRGMDPDDVFHVLKNAKSSLNDSKLDPDKQKKDATKEERYRIRQNMERVAGIAKKIHDENIAADPDRSALIQEEAFRSLISEESWKKNADGFEQIPYFRRNEYREEDTDRFGRKVPHYYPKKDTFQRNGVLELRPSGATGMSLYHIDDDGNETLLVDHRRATRGVVDVDQERKRTADNIKWQVSTLSRKSAYDNEAKAYRQRAERAKQRQEEAKQKARDRPKAPKAESDDEKPKQMHKDLVRWIHNTFSSTINTRPSDMTPEEKEKIISDAVAHSWLNIKHYASSYSSTKLQLLAAVAKKPETRSEKILYKKQKDFLNEVNASEDLMKGILSRYIQKVMKECDTTNPDLAEYVNDDVGGVFAVKKIPSRMTPEELEKQSGTYRKYQEYKRIDERLNKELSSDNLSPEKQAHLAEVIRENRIMLQNTKENHDKKVSANIAAGVRYPPPEVAKVIRSEKYPRAMTVDEREAWEDRLLALSTNEFYQIRPHLNALHLDKEWRKGMKDWKEHWAAISNIEYPRHHSRGES